MARGHAGVRGRISVGKADKFWVIIKMWHGVMCSTRCMLGVLLGDSNSGAFKQ